MQLQRKTIALNFEGINQDEIRRCYETIRVMLEQGVFQVKRGSVTLSFDHRGDLRDIDFHLKKWKADQPDTPMIKIFESVKMEIVGLPQTIRSDFSNEWTPDEKAMMRK